MGCCQSKDSQLPLNKDAVSSSSGAKGAGKNQEEKIELAFRAKRANIFTEGVDFESRDAFVHKRIAKTAKQSTIISKSHYIACFLRK